MSLCGVECRDLAYIVSDVIPTATGFPAKIQPTKPQKAFPSMQGRLG